jgi:hypothetical protein
LITTDNGNGLAGFRGGSITVGRLARRVENSGSMNALRPQAFPDFSERKTGAVSFPAGQNSKRNPRHEGIYNILINMG